MLNRLVGLQAIDRLEADVLTIENSRSGNEMINALAKYGYSRDIGPGVYDVHSPVVPRWALHRSACCLPRLQAVRRPGCWCSVDFMKDKIKSFLESNILQGHLDRIWVK